MAGFSMAQLSRFRGYLGRSREVDSFEARRYQEKRKRLEEEPQPKPKARRLLIEWSRTDRCDSSRECGDRNGSPQLPGTIQDRGQGCEDSPGEGLGFDRRDPAGVSEDLVSVPPDQGPDLEPPIAVEAVLQDPLPVPALLSPVKDQDGLPDERNGDQEDGLALVLQNNNDETRLRMLDTVFNHRTKGLVLIPTLESYRIEAVEGSGAYSVVYRASRIGDGRLFAIKCPLQGDRNVDKEIKLLKMFEGKHSIIRLEEVIRDGDRKYLVLEHVDHDNLQSLKRDMDVSDLRSYGFYLFKALNYMHQKKVVHRDVKPANFLYSMQRKVGYLVDFNLALELAVRTKRRPQKENCAQCLPSPSFTSFTEERKRLVRSYRLDTDETVVVPRPYDFNHSHPQKRMRPVEMTRKPLRDYILNNISSNSCGKRVSLTPVPLTVKPLATLFPSRPTHDLDQRRRTRVGTKGYGAPEVLLGSPQTVKIDIWSAAVTLLQLAVGRLPFSNGGALNTIQEIAKLCGTKDLRLLAEISGTADAFILEDLEHHRERISVAEWSKSAMLPSSFLDLIEKCLKVNPEERISAREAMQHEFFSPCLRARKETRLSKLLLPAPCTKT